MPTPVIYTQLETGPLDHVPETQRWKPRRVYYATTRERLPNLQRIDYGNRESKTISVGMALIGFGGPDLTWSDLSRVSRQAERDQIVDLSIAGLLEAGHINPSNNTPSHLTTGSVAWLLSDLNTNIRAARDKDLMIYVHGAKVNFYNACAFAAQIDHFMGRDMTSLAFSWPTRQNILAYGLGADVNRAYNNAHALKILIEELARESEAATIHIVAWSAGGRLVTAALSELASDHAGSTEGLRKKFRLGSIYLAAADVPGDEFLKALPGLNTLVDKIIVTASANDGALRLSKRVLGGEVRVGTVRGPLPQADDQIVRAADRLQVIDVSTGSEQLSFEMSGHRYWFDHPWASTDLILALRSDLSPAERGLQATSYPALWRFPDDYPEKLRALVIRKTSKLENE